MNADIDLEKEIAQGKDYVTRYDTSDMLATFIALSTVMSIKGYCEERKIPVAMTQKTTGEIRELTMRFNQ